jgi:hypothetical protein
MNNESLSKSKSRFFRIFPAQKRGDIFALWLVMITLFMCGIAITSYVFQQGNLDTAIVSPASLLKFEDRLGIYELNEETELRNQYCNGGSFSEVAFADSMLKHSSLFFEEKLYYNGEIVSIGAVDEASERVSFLKEMYSSFYEDGALVVRRDGAVRGFVLSSDERSKINFAIGVNVSLDKEYVFAPGFC